jgi:plastocyanin
VRRALVLVVLAALAAPAASLAVQRQNSIHANTFNPRTIRVIVDDTVRWTNHDFVGHDVQSDDGITFGSGILNNNGKYESPVFSAPGSVPYHCAQHSFMHGTVAVYDIWLGTPPMITFGSKAKFTGLAAVGTNVSIEDADDIQVGGPVPAGATGAYTVLISDLKPGSYRADDGTHESANVTLKVKPKLTIAKGKIRRGLWRVVVKATSEPNQQGATAIVDRKKGFGWAKLASKQFGLSSKATFTVQIPAGKSQLRVRVRLTNPKNEYSPATSASFVLKR